MIRKIDNEQQLPDLAADILAQHPDERVFGFYGEMGSGKTTLIKELCKVLNVTDQTSSPTFAIVNEYYTEEGWPVYHFDFYRINDIEELRQIGLYEYINSGYYCFMEWTEKAEPLLNETFVRVDIELQEDGSRIFKY